jgi:hypothetical protein
VRDQIVFIGVAQEKAKAFSGTKVSGQFQFNRDKTVYVNHYYFYIDDEDFGPLFLKVCSYAPWGIKLCLNGHEWAKRQLEKRGIEYEALDNGFLSCAEPEKLQQICDSLGPEQIDRVFRKWLKRIPLPLRPEDRRAGYDWDLSVWQSEVSLTQIFDRPLRGREFFEEVIRDNLDLGRPDRVQLIFDRVVTKKTPGEFKTRVIQDGGRGFRSSWAATKAKNAACAACPAGFNGRILRRSARWCEFRRNNCGCCISRWANGGRRRGGRSPSGWWGCRGAWRNRRRWGWTRRSA